MLRGAEAFTWALWHGEVVGGDDEFGTAALKAAMRRRFNGFREGLDGEAREAEAEAVARELMATLTWVRSLPPTRRAASGIDSGAPLRVLSFVGVKAEIDTAPLHAELWRQGARLWLPRIVGPGALVAEEVAEEDELCDGPYGLKEPRPSEAGLRGPALATLDLILAPGVIFGRCGSRLGQGGGYYDRMLGALPADQLPPCVGVGYTCQVVDAGALPAVDHDIRMDGVLTAAGFTLTWPRTHLMWQS